MSALADTFEALLRLRGTLGLATEVESPSPIFGAFRELPGDVREILAVQNGEDPMKTFALGYRFLSEREILELSENLRTMVEVDGTLPPAFLEFVPFICTGCKTDVGVFTSGSEYMSGEVIEFHYETGELVRWSKGMLSFLAMLVGSAELESRFGKQFPPAEISQVELESVIPWQPD